MNGAEAKNHHTNVNRGFHNLPPRQDKGLVGRESQLATLRDALSPQRRQHMLVVSGVAGVGKTALAIECGYRCLSSALQERSSLDKPVFEKVIFVSLAHNSRFSNSDSYLNKKFPDLGLSRITRTISDTFADPSLSRFSHPQDFELIYEKLTRIPTLLIIDGLDDFPDSEIKRVSNFLKDVPYPTKVIITTRQRDFPISHDPISLSPFTKEESLEFILSQEPDLQNDEVQKIASSVSGIPMALAYAVDRCRARQPIDYQEPDPSKSVDLSRFHFDKLWESLTYIEGLVLMCLSLFVNSASRPAMLAVAKFKDSVSDVDLDNALLKLEEIGIVSKTIFNSETHYSILPITREYILARLNANSQLDPKLEQEARARWVDWYRQDLFENFPDRLADEWENLREVLMWCQIEGDYATISDIWQKIDPVIMEKNYWTIRLYWWQYLAQEAPRPRDDAYALALLEVIDTCLAMGDRMQAQEYMDKAYLRFKFIDKSLQERLIKYLLNLIDLCLKNDDKKQAKEYLENAYFKLALMSESDRERFNEYNSQLDFVANDSQILQNLSQ